MLASFFSQHLKFNDSQIFVLQSKNVRVMNKQSLGTIKYCNNKTQLNTYFPQGISGDEATTITC